MNCPNCGMPESEHLITFDCGSYLGKNGKLLETSACAKIAHLRDLLLEALPYVQDCAVDPSYKERARPEIKGLAKRVENEVQK